MTGRRSSSPALVCEEAAQHAWSIVNRNAGIEVFSYRISRSCCASESSGAGINALDTWWYTFTSVTCQNHPFVPQLHPNCNCRPIPPGHWVVGASSKSALLWQKPTYSQWVLLNLAGFFLLILRRRGKKIHPMYIWVLTMTIPVI